MLRRHLAPLLALLIVFMPTRAWAQSARPAASSVTAEVDGLVAQLDADAKALDTSNCDTACKALASMMRAVQRICELEPGPRCDAARKKVEAARKRVLASCPDCEAASTKSATAKPDAPPPVGPAVRPGSLDQDHTAREPSVDPEPEQPQPGTSEGVDRPVSNAPPAAEAQSRGGCAPCGTGGAGRTSSGWLLLLGLAVIGCRRRQRRRPFRCC